MKDTTYAEAFIELFDDMVEENPELTEEQKQKLTGTFPTQESLENALPTLLEKVKAFDGSTTLSDTQIKDWQKTKKMWAARKATLLDILGRVLKELHIPGQSLKADGIKLSTSTRAALVVDEDWLVQQYQLFADQLQANLPPYVKVSLSVDKTRLNAYLKTDNSLLLQNPDKVYTKTSTSTTIK